MKEGYYRLKAGQCSGERRGYEWLFATSPDLLCFTFLRQHGNTQRNREGWSLYSVIHFIQNADHWPARLFSRVCSVWDRDEGPTLRSTSSLRHRRRHWQLQFSVPHIRSCDCPSSYSLKQDNLNHINSTSPETTVSSQTLHSKLL